MVGADQLILWLSLDPAASARLQTLKDWTFVVVTALLLYCLLRSPESEKHFEARFERSARTDWLPACLLYTSVLPPARDWRNGCPGLVRLGERLTSALVLRTPNRHELPDRPGLGQAFMIADERALLRFSDPRRLAGVYEPQPSERMKELLELFRDCLLYTSRCV